MRAWVFIVAACHAPQPASQPIVLNGTPGTLAVRVGAGGLTVEQLKAKLDALGAGKERYRDPKELRAFIDNQVRFELLAEEALRRGLDKDPEVQETARRAMVQKLMAIATEMRDPDDDDVEKAYNQNLGDFRQPERVQIAAYTLASKAEAEAALARLKASTDAPVDQRYLSESELVAVHGAEVAKAVFAVKEIGALGPIVQVDKKFTVFKVTGRRAAFNRPLADVAPGIKQRIARQKKNEAFEALIERLRAEMPVTIDEAKLQEVWK